eukprot:TRINITY_DN1538_c0_g4_i1.p2 TRINITY_DN1538_c0_g4~~TRINITY_DN1538_c0_g4_i1.p2  ORF type:complete len:102 (-),score=17.50 TRINITY_DN1538_c0_g4_i1:445-750(-)
MDVNYSSPSSSSRNINAIDASETNGEKVALTLSDSDALNVDSTLLKTTLNTEYVLDFSPALLQLICGADFLLYSPLDELLSLTLLSKNVSMLTRDHISKIQ